MALAEQGGVEGLRQRTALQLNEVACKDNLDENGHGNMHVKVVGEGAEAGPAHGVHREGVVGEDGHVMDHSVGIQSSSLSSSLSRSDGKGQSNCDGSCHNGRSWGGGEHPIPAEDLDCSVPWSSLPPVSSLCPFDSSDLNLHPC